MKKIAVILLALTFTVLQAQSVNLNFSRMQYGVPTGFGGARALSMGYAGLAGAEALNAPLINPALSVNAEGFISASVSGLMTKNEEDRSFPYYDNFGGFVDYGSFVYNQHWYSDLSAVLLFNLPVPLEIKTVAALSFAPLYDYNYTYLEEVRTTGFTDAILAYNHIESTGTLNEIALSLAFTPMDNLSVGVHAGIVTGTVEQKAEIDSVDQSMRGIRQVETNKFSPDNTPIRLQIGAAYQVDKHLTLAARYVLPMLISFKSDYSLQTQDITLFRALDPYSVFANNFSAGTAGYDSAATSGFTREIEYPASVGLGLEYRFTNILEARMNLDFIYTYWSDFSDNLNPDIRFEDTYAIRVGVEHIFFDNMPFRVGFDFHPLRENRELTETIFTAGTGMMFDQFGINMSGGLSMLTYQQADMYDNGKYAPLVTRTDRDKVSSNNYFISAELQYFLQ
jgi:hypothetical protein